MKYFLLLIAWEGSTWEKERTEIIPDGKIILSSLVTVTSSSVTTGIRFPSTVLFHSQGLMQDLNSHFQPTQQL